MTGRDKIRKNRREEEEKEEKEPGKSNMVSLLKWY